ncbi:MAG TPA: hypoxanthine phosphoribosyltransferase [Solirubrobacteraceae bacterium]|nr:hypoxanthine phosphoribosyltransferase [Solirubrobacteraceae bacterium]
MSERTAALRAAHASGLLVGAEPVLVLCSGGRDSTCLLDVAVTLCGRGRVSVLHVNYGLRGAESDGDEAHCRALAERLGVELEVVRAPPGPSGNVQAWARALRYGEAERRRRAAGALVAVGHTASDQAETILYRLAASPSRRALLGMQARGDARVRPLLEVTREQTAEHCRARGLTWREDSGNESDRYARTRVRRALLPALRAVHPAAEANVIAAAATLRAEAHVLDELVEQVLDGHEDVEVETLAALPAALARLVLVRLADAAAGHPAGGVGRRLAELLALGARGGPAALDVGDGVRAEIARGRLSMRTLHYTAAPEMPEPHSDPAIGEILVSASTLQARVREMAQEISHDYRTLPTSPGRSLLLVGVLKGAVFFLSDLMRHIDVPVEVDFMAVASYGSATDSSGVVRILKDLDVVIEGRDVLIVEDIVDSGLTLQYLLRNLGSRNPKSLEVCALLTKPARRKVELKARYVGFEIADRFAIGYGLDHAERYRNLPYVAALAT